MDEIIKVGDRLWRFDEHRRVYAQDDKGRSYGSALFEGHFVETTIVDETRALWLVKYGGFRNLSKVNKKTLREAGRDGPTGYYTDAGKADAIWSNAHRYRIRDRVQSPDIPIDQLRAIAKIIGYDDGSGL